MLRMDAQSTLESVGKRPRIVRLARVGAPWVLLMIIMSCAGSNTPPNNPKPDTSLGDGKGEPATLAPSGTPTANASMTAPSPFQPIRIAQNISHDNNFRSEGKTFIICDVKVDACGTEDNLV